MELLQYQLIADRAFYILLVVSVIAIIYILNLMSNLYELREANDEDLKREVERHSN